MSERQRLMCLLIKTVPLPFRTLKVIAKKLLESGVTVPVRCKDCKNWMYEYDDVGLCVTDVPDIDGVQRLACDFCSYGERKKQ